MKCNNITISNNNLTNFNITDAIKVYYSNTNNITENIIEGFGIGVMLHTSHTNKISSNLIHKNTYGMTISYAENTIVKENYILNNDEYGIRLGACIDSTLYLNYLINSGYSNAEDDFFSNNWDNGTIGNYWDDYSGNDLNDDGIGEVPYIVPGEGSNQDNFPIWDDGHNGSKIIIDDLSSNDWQWASTRTWCSGSGTYRDPYIIRNVVIDGNNSRSCLTIRNSNVYFIIANSTFYNSQSETSMYGGIDIEDSSNGILINNNCTNNNGNGIILDGSYNITIKENRIVNNGDYGISQVWSSYNISIVNNTLNNNQRGFFVSSGGHHDKIIGNIFKSNIEAALYLNPASFFLIKNNKIIDSGTRGIHIGGYNNTVFLNEISSSHWGIYLPGGVDTENNTISNNLIYDNYYGIYLDGDIASAGCRYNLFYNNTLQNRNLNAYDDGYSNSWDNGEVGNYWDDYCEKYPNATPYGIVWDTPYLIDGLANSQDNYPLIIFNQPQISTFPNDVSYEYGLTGNTLSWTVTDDSYYNPTYAIYCNGNKLQNQTWTSGVTITFSIDYLDIGQHNYTFIAKDGLGEFIEDQVNIIVFNLAPSISRSPNDVTYQHSTKGNVLVWEIIDNSYYNPTYAIYCNGNELQNQTWISGVTIGINIDGLDIGKYTYIIIISDGLGGTVQDNVLVEVVLLLPEYTFIILISLIVAFFSIAILVLYKYKIISVSKIKQKLAKHKRKKESKIKKSKKFKIAKIEIKRGLDFLGGFIRYKVAIKNKSKLVIANLDVSLQMTAEHVRIIDIKPRAYKKPDRAKIPNMAPEQSVSIDFILEPMICGNIPVAPLVTYIDAYNNPQILSGDSVELISKCPLIMNPGEENIAKVKNLFESIDIIKNKRTFELELDPKKVFNLLQEAIGKWAGKQVSKPLYESTEPFIVEVYYYTLNQIIDPELGHQEQIIMRIQVDESKNVATLSVGAEKNETVNGVLTNIWQLANETFSEIFQTTFESLHCPFCGHSTECLELNQNFTICSNCGEKCNKSELKRF